VIALENITTYHEIDFLLTTQRFNINFSYITQKGLPFVREFVLRLVHLAPMTKSQIAIFFGFSHKETEEAIADLVERGELTISNTGRLILTEKSSGYFNEIGDVPHLSLLQESSARLSFDLATFTCLGKDISADKWKTGIKIKVDDDKAARSESLVEKQFQLQFNEIFHKGLLSLPLANVPTVYAVNSVNKIRQTPFRLSVKFQTDANGRSVEREDFEILKSSDYVHEQITVELNRLARPNNLVDVAKAVIEIEDSDTLKLFDAKANSINVQFLEDLIKLEANSQERRTSFLGPIYTSANWKLLQKRLAPVLTSRIESKEEVGSDPFIWVAPSDPYWCKSNQLLGSLSEFLSRDRTKHKRLYSPTLYLPISGPDDFRTVRQWKNELDPFTSDAHGLIEGFLGGNVEVMYFEGELAVVVYHMSIPDAYPVTVPLGFISADREVVSAIGRLVKTYIAGSSGFDRPNDCGLLSGFGHNK
jgi:hypothetical protein